MPRLCVFYVVGSLVAGCGFDSTGKYEYVPTTSDSPSTGSDNPTTSEGGGNGSSEASSASTSDDDPSSTGAPPICGDGVVDDGEECDDSEESTQCDADCTKVICGDGNLNIQASEACDEGDENSDEGSCLTSCQLAACGDGLIQTGAEECDDQPRCADLTSCVTDADCEGKGDELCQLRDTDTCTNACKLAFCGDGILQKGVDGCDDGSHCADLTPCTTDADCKGNGDELCEPRDTPLCNKDEGGNCSPPLCGDGIVQEGEQCDEGSFGGSTCTPQCASIEGVNVPPDELPSN